MTFRRVVVPLRGPGQSPVLPFACCVGSLLSVGHCGWCSCWCRFRVRGAQWSVCWDHPLWTPPPPLKCLGKIFSWGFGRRKLFSGAFDAGPFGAPFLFGADQNSGPVSGGVGQGAPHLSRTVNNTNTPGWKGISAQQPSPPCRGPDTLCAVGERRLLGMRRGGGGWGLTGHPKQQTHFKSGAKGKVVVRKPSAHRPVYTDTLWRLSASPHSVPSRSYSCINMTRVPASSWTKGGGRGCQ